MTKVDCSPQVRIAVAVVLAAGLLCATVCAAAEDLPAAESELAAVQEDISSVGAERQAVLVHADELAGLITGLQERDGLSRAEHETLEGYLRDAQSLQERLHTLDARLGAGNDRRAQLIDLLISMAQKETAQVLERLESADSTEDDTARLRALIEKREAWQAMRGPSFDEAADAFAVEANPEDTPRRLRMKGDILTDQAEAVRRDAAQMEGRIESLREERQVREKVRELASEMTLFDESEELMSREGLVSDPNRYDGSVDTGEPGEPEAVAVGASEGILGLAFQSGIAEAMNDPVPRSPEAIKTWIERLAGHRDRLLARADSLRERSQWFYERADDPGDAEAPEAPETPEDRNGE